MELVVSESQSPTWLPAGSRVQIVRRRVPPQPMSLVRLLLRRDDEVFCVPREESTKLDLPTRTTAQGDTDGSQAIAALAEAATGSTSRPTFLGAVRNIVPSPPPTYAWPAPEAHFGIWLIDAEPVIDGSWIDLAQLEGPLRDRHWYPLVAAR